VRLDLMLAPEVLSLEISDNGRGLNSRDLAKARSFGIRGLQERAATVGGWIDLSSSARGTTLILSIPMAESTEARDAPTAEDEQAESAHDPSAWGDL
jgi:glucose-6-phosphate-specific signal transduction histidine kinase